jgi:DNA helicase-2/ATP-dependent DNA helicase PcrA
MKFCTLIRRCAVVKVFLNGTNDKICFVSFRIKDALAYLRLIENSADGVAFERVVNFPTRGIGATTVEKVRVFARENQTQLFQAAISMASTLPARAANALTGFTQLIILIAA